MSALSVSEASHTTQISDMKSEFITSNISLDSNITNSRCKDKNPSYGATTSTLVQLKSHSSSEYFSPDMKLIFAGSLLSMGKSDVGNGCYDVTLKDGSSGTLIKGLPDAILGLPSHHTKDSTVGLMDNSFSTPAPPLFPSAPPSATQTDIKDILNTRARDSKVREKSSDPDDKMSSSTSSIASAMRPGGRHHLVDIHGMAMFLRKSTRCIACKEANCLYVTGTVSAQLGAVTQVKITCQKCHNTASQPLLKPNQAIDQSVPQRSTDSSNQHEVISGKESIGPKQQRKDLRQRPKDDREKTSSTSVKSPKEKESVKQKQYKAKNLSTMQFPLTNAWQINEESDTDNLNKKITPRLEPHRPDINSEWMAKNIPDMKTEKLASPPSCLFADITTPDGFNNLDAHCNISMCGQKNSGTSKCSVTGSLQHFPPDIKYNHEYSAKKPSLDISEPLIKKKQYSLDTTDRHFSSKKESYLTKLLESNLHNSLSPVSSPCSLSSSSSSSLSSTSASGIYSNISCDMLSASSPLLQTAPSLLSLWSSQDMISSLPFSTQMYSGTNAYDYQLAQTPTTPQTSLNTKRKPQESIDESLKKMQKLIYNAQTPSKYKAHSDINGHGLNDIPSVHKNEPKESLDLERLLYDNQKYLAYLQEKILTKTSGDTCCSKECHSRSPKTHKNTHKHKTDPCYKEHAPKKHCVNINSRCKSPCQVTRAKHKSQNETDRDVSLTGSSSELEKRVDDIKDSSPFPPSNCRTPEERKTAKKKSSNCSSGSKNLVKFEKKQLKRRCKFDIRMMKRWIRANSRPFHCCHNTVFQNRKPKKNVKKIHQLAENKIDSSSFEEDSATLATSMAQPPNKSKFEDLRDFLDKKDEVNMQKGDTCKSDTKNDKKYIRNEQTPKASRKDTTLRKTAGETDNTSKMDHEEHYAVSDWMTCENTESKRHKGKREGKFAKGRHHCKYINEETIKSHVNFHDLLSSESGSDSEEGKLTIDMNEEISK